MSAISGIAAMAGCDDEYLRGRDLFSEEWECRNSGGSDLGPMSRACLTLTEVGSTGNPTLPLVAAGRAGGRRSALAMPILWAKNTSL